MIKKRWSADESAFLKENYVNLSIKDISEHLKRSNDAIRAKAKRLKLTKNYFFFQLGSKEFFCRKCKALLIVDKTWNKNDHNRKNYLCRKCLHEYQKAWYKKHRIKYRRRQREKRLELKLKTFALFGGKCVRCGFSDWRALQIDHIHGGEKKDWAEFKSYDSYFKKILNLTEKERNEKYQLLCANCNWIKRRLENEGVGPRNEAKKPA